MKAFMTATQETNSALQDHIDNQRMKQALSNMGFTFKETYGEYACQAEHTFIVDLPKGDEDVVRLLELAESFRQECIMIEEKDGTYSLVDTDGDVTHESTGTRTYPTEEGNVLSNFTYIDGMLLVVDFEEVRDDS